MGNMPSGLFLNCSIHHWHCIAKTLVNSSCFDCIVYKSLRQQRCISRLRSLYKTPVPNRTSLLGMYWH